MKIVSIAVSKKKGTRKQQVPSATLIENHGIKGDAHAGDWHRQVSLLALESIQKMRDLDLDVGFGDFAENIATTGLDLPNIPVGTRLKLGKHVILEISQIGKICHKKCAIYYQAGDCIMPKEGALARVLVGGTINNQDPVEILPLVVENRAC